MHSDFFSITCASRPTSQNTGYIFSPVRQNSFIYYRNWYTFYAILHGVTPSQSFLMSFSISFFVNPLWILSFKQTLQWENLLLFVLQKHLKFDAPYPDSNMFKYRFITYAHVQICSKTYFYIGPVPRSQYNEVMHMLMLEIIIIVRAHTIRTTSFQLYCYQIF